MMKKIIIDNKGFTLIETLIYIALIGATLSSFISFGMSIASLRNKTHSMDEVVSNSRLAMDTIVRKIREAKTVQSPAKGASATSLVLEMPDSSILTFAPDAGTGALTMTDGVGTGSLAASGMVIFPVLNFTNLGDASGKDNVKIEMTARYKNDGGSNDMDYSVDLETAVNAKEHL